MRRGCNDTMRSKCNVAYLWWHTILYTRLIVHTQFNVCCGSGAVNGSSALITDEFDQREATSPSTWDVIVCLCMHYAEGWLLTLGLYYRRLSRAAELSDNRSKRSITTQMLCAEHRLLQDQLADSSYTQLFQRAGARHSLLGDLLKRAWLLATSAALITLYM